MEYVIFTGIIIGIIFFVYYIFHLTEDVVDLQIKADCMRMEILDLTFEITDINNRLSEIEKSRSK